MYPNQIVEEGCYYDLLRSLDEPIVDRGPIRYALVDEYDAVLWAVHVFGPSWIHAKSPILLRQFPQVGELQHPKILLVHLAELRETF